MVAVTVGPFGAARPQGARPPDRSTDGMVKLLPKSPSTIGIELTT